MAAGSLNRRVSIYASTETTNSVGETHQAWSKVATVWAARQSLALREVNRMSALQETAEGKFEIRYRAGITTGMEVECEGRRYAIVAVDEVGNRVGLALLVKAV